MDEARIKKHVDNWAHRIVCELHTFVHDVCATDIVTDQLTSDFIVHASALEQLVSCQEAAGLPIGLGYVFEERDAALAKLEVSERQLEAFRRAQAEDSREIGRLNQQLHEALSANQHREPGPRVGAAQGVFDGTTVTAVREAHHTTWGSP